MPNDFLAKQEQLFFYVGLRPIAASIKEGLLLLRSTIVLLVLLQAFPSRMLIGKIQSGLKKRTKKKVDQVNVLATWC